MFGMNEDLYLTFKKEISSDRLRETLYKLWTSLRTLGAICKARTVAQLNVWGHNLWSYGSLRDHGWPHVHQVWAWTWNRAATVPTYLQAYVDADHRHIMVFKRQLEWRRAEFLSCMTSKKPRATSKRSYLSVFLADDDPVLHTIEAMSGTWYVWCFFAKQPFLIA